MDDGLSGNQNLGRVKTIEAERRGDQWEVHFVEGKVAERSMGKIILKSTHDPIIVDMIHFEDICGDVNIVQHGGSIGSEELGEETQCMIFNLGKFPNEESHLYCTGNHDFFESMRKRYKIPKYGEAYFEDEEPPLVIVERRK